MQPRKLFTMVLGACWWAVDTARALWDELRAQVQRPWQFDELEAEMPGERLLRALVGPFEVFLRFELPEAKWYAQVQDRITHDPLHVGEPYPEITDARRDAEQWVAHNRVGRGGGGGTSVKGGEPGPSSHPPPRRFASAGAGLM